MNKLISRHPLGSFFVIAFGVTYLVWSPAVVAGGFGNLPPIFTSMLQVVAPFGPAVAAITVILIEKGHHGLKVYGRSLLVWRTNPLWYGVALLIPIATMLAA